MKTLSNNNFLSGLLKLLMIFFLIPEITYSQGQDKLWLMGYGCCSTNFTGYNMDFRSGSLSIYPVQRYFNFACTNGQISDSNGNTLFYSNGIYIANTLGDTMLNGSGINPSSYTTSHSQYGLLIPQGNLVIPFPNDSTKYYLFHETSDDQGGTYASVYLYYSVIDMTLDGGKGGVIQKNTVLLNDSLVVGRLTASKHANGRDWWIFSHQFHSSLQYRYLVTPSGIIGPWIDDLQTWRGNYPGQACFSEDGNKYVYFEPFGGLDIWDFDRCTGLFDNLIHVDIVDSGGAGGVAFSRSGRFLYVSKIYFLYQFDLFASDVPMSKLLIATYDGFVDPPGVPTVFYLQKLAPDDKIYMVSSSTVYNIHAINSPDSLGLACDFQQHSVHLPGYNGLTLPNFPNYFLGAVGSSICDSLPTAIREPASFKSSFEVFPNPVQRLMYIMGSSKEKVESIRLINSIGQLMKQNFTSIKNEEYLEEDLSGLSSGIYYLEIKTAKQRIVKKVVKE